MRSSKIPAPLGKQCLWLAGGGLCSGCWRAVSPSHYTHTWRANPQGNFTFNPAPRALGQRQSCALGRWRAWDRSGCGWVLGRVWLISYGAGCWVGAQCGCCAPPASLHLGLAAQWEARTSLLAPLALQGVEVSVDQVPGPGQSPSHPRSWRGASSSSTRTGDIHPSIPQAVPAGPTRSGLAGPASLSWLEQRWLQAVHPCPTLCSLQSCLALAPSPTRTQLSTGVMLGGSDHTSTKNGFDSKVGDPGASTEHPGLPAGEAGECQLCDCSDPPFAEWQVPHYSA